MWVAYSSYLHLHLRFVSTGPTRTLSLWPRRVFQIVIIIINIIIIITWLNMVRNDFEFGPQIVNIEYSHGNAIRSNHVESNLFLWCTEMTSQKVYPVGKETGDCYVTGNKGCIHTKRGVHTYEMRVLRRDMIDCCDLNVIPDCCFHSLNQIGIILSSRFIKY